MLPLENLYRDRTLVFGHRGSKAYAPMNTIPAFELAFQQGADGIELDTHLSSDGIPIILHDFDVDTTTEGHGYAKDKTLSELKELDAGKKFGEAFAGTRIPTLDEVFEAVGKKLIVNIEITSESEETDGVEQAVADCIAHHRMQSRIIVSSFNPLTLRRFRTIMPEVPIGFLHAPGYTFFPEVMESLPHEARHPHETVIDAAYVEWAHKHNWRINTWTVNNPLRAVELRNLGVDAIITDVPDVVIGALRGTSS